MICCSASRRFSLPVFSKSFAVTTSIGTGLLATVRSLVRVPVVTTLSTKPVYPGDAALAAICAFCATCTAFELLSGDDFASCAKAPGEKNSTVTVSNTVRSRALTFNIVKDPLLAIGPSQDGARLYNSIYTVLL